LANILIGITGGIAAYKTAYLARLFITNSHNVRIIMTIGAERFITPLTFQALTNNPVLSSIGSASPISHIEFAEWADIMIIAPATANSIAKINHGIADNELTSTVLALKSPLLIAPAMNSNMYTNIATKQNISDLKSKGIYIIEPTEGVLACGDVGVGKLAEPIDIYHEAINILASNSILAGLKIIVTAGGTREAIDPVRYITNRSSGKMGQAIAEIARSMGAETLLITTKTDSDSKLKFNNSIYVNSADEMYNSLKEHINNYDILIMAAAISDYKVTSVSDKKIKKSGNNLELTLIENIDILETLSKTKLPHQIFVGFAAESDELENNAIKKLKTKHLDMIVANDISRSDIGFDSDMNEVSIFLPDGKRIDISKQSKKDIARHILKEVQKMVGK